MTRTLPALALVLALSAPALAEPPAITVTSGKADQANVVVKFPLKEQAAYNVVEGPGGMTLPAQIAPPSQFDDPAVKQYLVFVLPKLKAGDAIAVKPGTVNYFVQPPHFEFVEKKGEPTELLFTSVSAKRPVMQYFALPHDKDDHFYTFKPFHNVYDP